MIPDISPSLSQLPPISHHPRIDAPCRTKWSRCPSHSAPWSGNSAPGGAESAGAAHPLRSLRMGWWENRSGHHQLKGQYHIYIYSGFLNDDFVWDEVSEIFWTSFSQVVRQWWSDSLCVEVFILRSHHFRERGGPLSCLHMSHIQKPLLLQMVWDDLPDAL